MCVGNGSHFCTPILTTMCNITFQLLRLSTFVFNRRWPSITSALGQCIELSGVSGAGTLRRHQHNAAIRKHGTITQCCFNDGSASKTVGQH